MAEESRPVCEVCGEPMLAGEEMFKYHGYSGPCPKPPLKKAEPKEPTCPPGRKPHSERVRDINDMLAEGMTAAVCIDNTPEHREWYLHAIAKYPQLQIELQGDMSAGIYLIRVRKVAPAN